MKKIIWDQSIRVGNWVCARLDSLFDEKTGVAIGQEFDGELIGGVAYDNYRGGSICMHVASSRSDWLNKAFLYAAFAYPFLQLNVNKVIGTVDRCNEQACMFDERLGFTLEAIIAGAGRNGDLLIYSMTRAQCRYLTR